jgi:hypothetical protein
MLIRTLAIGSFLAALAACSSGPQTRTSNTATTPAPLARNCTPSNTATRLPPRPGECPAGDVKSYSGEQLEQTGATQVGDALRYLDPEVTITHH